MPVFVAPEPFLNPRPSQEKKLLQLTIELM